MQRLDELAQRWGLAPRINESTTALWRVHLAAAMVVVATTAILFVAGDYWLGAGLLLMGGPINGAWAWKGWRYQRQDRPVASASPATGPEQVGPSL